MEEVWASDNERIDLIIFLNGIPIMAFEHKCKGLTGIQKQDYFCLRLIVEHFRTTVTDELGGTAIMVIIASREGAVKHQKAFEGYIAQKGYDNIHALVAFSGKVTMKEDNGQRK